MAFSLHVHHRYPELPRLNSDQWLLGIYIVSLAIVVIAMLVAGIALIEGSRAFVPPQ